MPFLLPFLISHLMCCVKVYYLSWTFLSLKLKKGRGSGGRERERDGESEREVEGGWGGRKKLEKPSAEVCQVDKAFRFGDVFRGSPFPAAKSC